MADKALQVTQEIPEAIVDMVLDAVTSPNTKRAYRRALVDFLGWYRETEQGELNKATVQRYAAELRAAGKSAANVNQRLSAIRKLASEAADNAAMPEQVANGIQRVRGIRQEGRKLGRWLCRTDAERLINAPPLVNLQGLRDRAVLAVLIGCGLRRSEAASLTFGHIEQREGRWVIVDMVGKRNKTRSVPMPSWAKVAIDMWATAAGLGDGLVFRSIAGTSRVSGEGMTGQAIADVVGRWAPVIGADGLAAHDLRRTYAKLAHKGGAALEQIQLSLGHASIQTTELYLGVEQDLTDAPCDRLGIRLE